MGLYDDLCNFPHHRNILQSERCVDNSGKFYDSFSWELLQNFTRNQAKAIFVLISPDSSFGEPV